MALNIFIATRNIYKISPYIILNSMKGVKKIIAQNKINKTFTKRTLFLIGVFILVGLIVYFVPWQKINFKNNQPVLGKEGNGLVRLHKFNTEIYDKIKQNYWKKISDKELLNLYKLAIQKIEVKQAVNDISTKSELSQLIDQILSNKNQAQQKKLLWI